MTSTSAGRGARARPWSAPGSPWLRGRGSELPLPRLRALSSPERPGGHAPAALGLDRVGAAQRLLARALDGHRVALVVGAGQPLVALLALGVGAAPWPRAVLKVVLAPPGRLLHPVQHDPAAGLLPPRVVRADLQLLAPVPDLAERGQPVVDEVDEHRIALGVDPVGRGGLEADGLGHRRGVRLLPRGQLLRAQLGGGPRPDALGPDYLRRGLRVHGQPAAGAEPGSGHVRVAQRAHRAGWQRVPASRRRDTRPVTLEELPGAD